jgi:hypothetical protein
MAYSHFARERLRTNQTSYTFNPEEQQWIELHLPEVWDNLETTQGLATPGLFTAAGFEYASSILADGPSRSYHEITRRQPHYFERGPASRGRSRKPRTEPVDLARCEQLHALAVAPPSGQKDMLQALD